MKVRSVGNTLYFNKKYNIYFDSEGSKVCGFDYLGLYYDKYVQFIGKIKKVVVAKLIDNKINLKEIDGCAKELTQEEEKMLIEAINDESAYYGIKNNYTTYFLIDKFIETSYKKGSPGGLQGAKIFDLEKLCDNFKRNMPVEEIANKLNGKEWPEKNNKTDKEY